MTQFNNIDFNKQQLNAFDTNRDFVLASFCKAMIAPGVEGTIHFLEMIRNLRAIFGDNLIREKYKERYSEILNILQTANLRAQIVSSYLLGLRAQTINAADISNKRFQEFINSMAELSLINQEIYNVGFLLFNNTNLAHLPLSSALRSALQKDLENFKLIFDSDKEKTFGQKKIEDGDEE